MNDYQQIKRDLARAGLVVTVPAIRKAEAAIQESLARDPSLAHLIDDVADAAGTTYAVARALLRHLT